jgi:SEC-C motif domain protein
MAAECPCGSGRTYEACCGRWHTGPLQFQAPDARALMRSRYSAYVLGLHDYLLATWHPRTRPAALAPDEPGLKWLGLQVQRLCVQDADHATVAFVARSKLGGRAQRLVENSRFVREGGRWFYLDGDSG